MPEEVYSPRNAFEQIVLRIVGGENVNCFEKELSSLFELISWNLLRHLESRWNHYFDGVAGLHATLVEPHKVQFTGEMWIGCESEQWTEPFLATVVDKRITKQGFWITVRVGADQGEGDSVEALRLYRESK